MILFPGRHLMGILECHQLTPPNNMVELKTHELCVKNQVEFMVQLEWVDVEFTGFFSLPNLHPLTLMVKKARISVSGHEPRSTGSVDRGSCPDTEIRAFLPKVWACQDMKPGPQGLPRPEKVGSPCQDMKLGPRELAFQKNLDLRVRTWNQVHRANWCTTISTTGPIYAKSSNFYAKLNVSNLNVTNLY